MVGKAGTSVGSAVGPGFVVVGICFGDAVGADVGIGEFGSTMQ